MNGNCVKLENHGKLGCLQPHFCVAFACYVLGGWQEEGLGGHILGMGHCQRLLMGLIVAEPCGVFAFRLGRRLCLGSCDGAVLQLH